MRLGFQICKMGETIVQITKERGLNKIWNHNAEQRGAVVTDLGRSLLGPQIFESMWVMTLPPPRKVIIKIR